jgi:transposase
MLSREEDVDAHALRRQGWTISAIARHLGRDRKTIRAYLNGERVPGYRRQSPDAFVPFLEYCRQRLADDPHLWASTLFDEVTALGYAGAYSTFTPRAAPLSGAPALRAVQDLDRPGCRGDRPSAGRGDPVRLA